MKISRFFALLALFAATDAFATLRPLPTHVATDIAGATIVDVTIMNEGTTTETFAAPERLTALLRDRNGEHPVTLMRVAGGAATLSIGPGGFGRVAYRTALPGDTAGALALTIPAWGGEGLAFGAPASAESRQAAASGPVGSGEAYVARYRSADGDRGNAFLPNLSAYEPIYAVYGPGTDSDARLQISFKYQLFGDARDATFRWIDGIHLAFTQRLYWDLGKESSPFRNVDYLPELFYLLPPRAVSSRIALGGQAGFRHESNGRGGAESRSYNTVYVQPFMSTAIDSFRLTVAPRLWLYVGSREDNPDIRRYRGNTGLLVEIGRDGGWRLTTQGRLNPGSGKGALDALLSYPLDALIRGAPKLYVFGQGFVGYGENLLDYSRHETRLRAGFGIVR